jgi:hypothetical protein
MEKVSDIQVGTMGDPNEARLPETVRFGQLELTRRG